MMWPTRCLWTIVACVWCGTASTPASAAPETTVVGYSVQRWTAGPGADGRVYALVFVDAHWAWRDARTLAQEIGGDLAPTATADAFAFVTALATQFGAFDCAGPWLGGYRFGGQPWRWTSNAAFVGIPWAPGHPSQAVLLDAALCLGGDESPDGTVIDALPGPDAGAKTKSSVMVWDSFEDCNANDLPDRLEIALHPEFDRDFNGALDECSTTNPADFNRDGIVDGADLGLLLGAWGTASEFADINDDGTVDGADLGILLGVWSVS